MRALAAWRERVRAAADDLGWAPGETVARLHPGGATLAFTAPVDQLYTATEVNEWVWGSLQQVHALHAPGHPATWDAASARETLQRMARGEANTRLLALMAAAHARGLPTLLDDDALTLGLGEGCRTWRLDALPASEEVPWSTLRGVPTALVTGSNGKTTTVRLLAAMQRAHGWHAGHSCTDGVFVDGEQIATGDFSGPGGARAVLRDPRVQAAVLETARGGLLRRGLAVSHADVAAITNISDDHFGEYGIHDLEGLADVKLTIGRAVEPDGVLVLNADDPHLSPRVSHLRCRFAWFALDYDHPRLQAHRAAGGATCGVRDGRLRLGVGDIAIDVADVATMPLSAGGAAIYNLGNASAAVLLAQALGIDTSTIAQVLAKFGSEPADNPGRLQRWEFGGVRVLLDYAHNPAGLQGLLRVARAGWPGRLGLVLGQAGNRGDGDIRALAGVAAEARPALVVLKDIDGFIRGRATGEVPQVIGDELRRRGFPEDQLRIRLAEFDAARELLAWALPGDVLVLPIHGLEAKAKVSSLLDALQASGWTPGEPLPAS